MKTLARACALLCALELGAPLSAQVAQGASSASAATATDNSSAMADALQRRTDLVNYVLSGQHPAEDALQQLHAIPSPTGMQLDADADFAFAAIDVGRRLIALHKPVEAEAFFQAAEISLDAVIDRTPDTSLKDKVQYLEARANIRAEFLNKLTDARSDFDAALKLSPDDKRLQQLSRLLPADPAATLQNHKELPAKG
jgi:hypothetical protein